MADLDPDRIAKAALAVLDKRGLEGFTMRSVAVALRVTPMALYHHVKDKAALAALVVDAASTERPLPPPTGNWQEDLWLMAQWMREGRMAHPNVVQLRRAYGVWTPSMLRMVERWFGLWQQSGLKLDKAVLAATTSSMAIVGIMEEESIIRDLTPPDPTLLSWLPNVRTAFCVQHDHAAEYELVVRSLIDGLYARLSKESIPRSTEKSLSILESATSKDRVPRAIAKSAATKRYAKSSRC